MSNADDPFARKSWSQAHIAVVIMLVFVAIALVLGIGTGVINERTFHRPVPSPSDPITIP